MDPFIALAQRHVEAVTRDVGHSALPDAPVLPVRPRRRAISLLAGLLTAVAGVLTSHRRIRRRGRRPSEQTRRRRAVPAVTPDQPGPTCEPARG